MNDEPAQPARARRAHPRPVTGSRVKRASDFLNLKLETRVRLLEEMTTLECAQLFHDWAFWARPEQAPPDGDWIIWLILAGRGAGKTRAGAEAVRTWVQTYPIVNLIGATIADARDIMVRGESGILACCRRDERPRFLAADLRLEWPNGAVSALFSAEEPDRLRGKQHMKLWCDELAAWRQPDAFDQAMLGLRLGDKPQAIITTTPRPTKIIKTLAADKDTIVTRGSTFDNKAHLARAFFERITARYQGRAIGRQELFAEIVEETPGSFMDARASRTPAHRAGSGAGGILRDRGRGRSPRPFGRTIRRMRDHRRRQGAGRPLLCAGRPHQPGRDARLSGARGSARPIAASTPTGWWPKSTTAARWSPRCCARASRTFRCAR